VIIPVYGRAGKLSRAIRSVQSQVDVEVEILVVDDHSPDAGAIAAAASGGVRLLRLPRNMGPGPARNHGASHATHHVLAFLDADDEWLTGSLRRRLELVTPGRCVVGDCLWIHDVTGATGLTRVASDAGSWLPYENLIHPSSVVLLKEDFERLGGFPADRDCAEDWVFGMRALRAGIEIRSVGVPVVLAHRAQDNTTSDHATMIAHALGAVRLMETEGLGTPDQLRRTRSVVHARVAGFEANAGHPGAAIAHAGLAMRLAGDARVRRELAGVPLQAARGVARRARDRPPARRRRQRSSAAREAGRT
jgi:hypothetical protein